MKNIFNLLLSILLIGQSLFSQTNIVFEKDIRFSPRSQNKSNTYKQLLNGSWHFIPNAKSDFYTELSFKDTLIPVPSQLDAVYHTTDSITSTGFYRKFFVPMSWKGKRIKLQCHSVDGLGKIYINGNYAGQHNGPVMPFEIDITGHVKPGKENQLAIYITSSKLSAASHRNFLGILRNVELLALPEINISKLHINTHFDTSYKNAQLAIDYHISNESTRNQDQLQLKFNLVSPKGNLVLLNEKIITIENVPDGKVYKGEFSTQVKNPVKWSNEHPNLYALQAILMLNKDTLEMVEEKFGFRQIEVKGKELLLNGVPIKLKGMCYHPEYPGLRHAITPDLIKKDLELFKAANVNFLRPWPPSKEIIKLCDEMGMLVQLETTLSFVEVPWDENLKGLVDDSTFIADFTYYNLEKVNVYHNHPSVIIWCLGNESKFDSPAFEAAGLATKKADPSRPVMVDAYKDEPSTGLSFTDIDNVHYPVPGKTFTPTDRPMFHGEWCHINNYHPDEITADPGVRDYWGKYLVQHVNYMMNTPGVLGGNIFSGNDFSYDPGAGAGNVLPTWGIFDMYRRPKPEYWHVKKAYSPIEIDLSSVELVDQRIQFNLSNRFHFTNLKQVKCFWRLAEQRGEVSFHVPPGKTAWVSIPLNGFADVVMDDRLHLSFYKDSILLDTYSINLHNKAVSADQLEPNYDNESPTLIENKTSYTVTGSKYSLLIDKTTGKIIHAGNTNATVITGGPNLFATPLLQGETGFAGNWVLSSITHHSTADSVVIKVSGKYNEAYGKYNYVFHKSGQIHIYYDFTWKKKNEPLEKKDWWIVPPSGDMRETGIAFEVHPELSTLSWKRKGLWTNYPKNHIGRLEGSTTAFPTSQKGKSLPWSEDTTVLGSNDFRSTKQHILSASLHGSNIQTITLKADGTKHTRCYVDKSGKCIQMLVQDFYTGGYEIFLLGNGMEYKKRVLDKGKIIKGKVALSFYTPEVFLR